MSNKYLLTDGWKLLAACDSIVFNPRSFNQLYLILLLKTPIEFDRSFNISFYCLIVVGRTLSAKQIESAFIKNIYIIYLVLPIMRIIVKYIT